MHIKRLGGVRGSAPTRNAADRPRSKRRSDPNGDFDEVKCRSEGSGRSERSREGGLIGVSSLLYIIGVKNRNVTKFTTFRAAKHPLTQFCRLTGYIRRGASFFVKKILCEVYDFSTKKFLILC